jgi:tight adherence protein B
MDILIGIGIFLSTVLFIEGLYLAFRAIKNPERARVKKELRSFSIEDSQDTQSHSFSIEKKRVLSDIDWLNNFLWKIPKITQFENLWAQSNSRFPISVYFLSALLISIASFFILYSTFIANMFLVLIVAAGLGMIPFFILYQKKKKRNARFERQLPDALELIARALKAGHAFTTGMKMVANEFGDPLGTEFGRTIDEISFGLEMEQALKNLLQRIDCEDLKFFVMAMILHREAGGNLAEILGNISRLIRDRFRLQRKVKVLSAQGRLSAMVLIALPIIVALVVSITAPAYLPILVTDPTGRLMVMTAVILEILGIMVIRRIIDIKV